jgi:hypothetical protein
MGARQAAEAIFKPKPPALKQTEAHLDSPENPQGHQPRILGISVPGPRPQEQVEPSGAAAGTTEKRIADAEAARVKTWIKYGMTIPQVAVVYGVALTEVQRVLRKG